MQSKCMKKGTKYWQPASTSCTAHSPPSLLSFLPSACLPARSPRELLGSPTGVFVGCIWSSEFGELLAHHGAHRGSQAVTGNGLAFMAGRLSYSFGLTGVPSLPLITLRISYASSAIKNDKLTCPSELVTLMNTNIGGALTHINTTRIIY